MTRRLVIADDEAPLRGLLRTFVERDGRLEVVAEASDGPEALAAVTEHDPDVLLLDLGLPVLDGLEVLERLPQGDRPRTIVLTGYDDAETRRTVRERGAADCFVKGGDFGELLDVLAAE